MKNKSFTLINKELLLVELPEGANRIHVFNDNDNPYISYFKGGDTGRYYIDFNVKLIGKLPEVTEDQYAKLVEKNYWDMGTGGYIDYSSNEPTDSYAYAKESFFSKLEADGVLFVNPIRKPDSTCNCPSCQDVWYIKNKQWQSAQEKVFNIDNTYLFERV